jgi:taurine transport system substrate-binding protein
MKKSSYARTGTLGAAVVLLSLTGCVQSGRDASPAGNAATACPWTADDSVQGEVKLGWQASPTGDLVVKDMKLLESCMPKAKFTWSQFSSGADVIQAFGAKSIDLGMLGSSPTTIALSQPLQLPIKVVWIQEVIGEAESLVARDASVKTLADLKGKTVAVPFSSTAHFSLLQALDGAGLKPGTDVKLVNLAPDAMLAAWSGKQIDAAWVWNPVLGELLKTGKRIYSSADTAKAGKPTFDLSAATTDFITKNPAFMKQWAKAQDYAVGQITTKPEKASEAIALQMGVSPKEVGDQLSGYLYLPASEQASQKWLGGTLGKDLLVTAKFLLSQGSVKGVSPDQTYMDAVDPTPASSVKG